MLTEELYYKTEKTSSKKEKKKRELARFVLSHLFLGGPAAINVMCPLEDRLSPIKKKKNENGGILISNLG